MFITQHYDGLFSSLDSYTNKLLQVCSDDDVIVRKAPKSMHVSGQQTQIENSESYGVDSYFDPCISEFNEDLDQSQILPRSGKLVDYVKLTQARAVEELRKAQEENLRDYETNKAEISMKRKYEYEEKVNDDQMRHLFANKFCFLMSISKSKLDDDLESGNQLQFSILTIISDLYVNKSQIELIK